MAWYPEAVRKEITKHRRPLTEYNRVNLHVAVSEAESLYGYFSNPNTGVVSHFYVRKSGVVEQYVSTAYRAAADLEGNDATISIETQGGVNSPQTEPWTDAQLNSLASIYKWARETHGIANQMATDSRRGITSKGLSWHRLGVDPWRVAGGMKYSNSRGKICPGDAKIAQIPTIFAMSQGAVAPAPTPDPTPPVPAPTPTPPAPSGIDVDGYWGSGTTRRLQEVLGTPVDGVVSSQHAAIRTKNPGLRTGWQWVTRPQGSLVIKEVQRRMGMSKVDGIIGPDTIKALQRRMGTPVDGVVSNGSLMVQELQRRLNRGTF